MTERKRPGHFAAKLKELREAAGLSQKQLAERAGMTLGGFTKLEQGYRLASWDTATALAAALGVSCEAFQQEPAQRPPAGRGRPSKGEKPARKRGKK